jgi:hypothetical protein
MNSNRVPFPWNPADYRPRTMLIQPVAGERNIGPTALRFPFAESALCHGGLAR